MDIVVLWQSIMHREKHTRQLNAAATSTAAAAAVTHDDDDCGGRWYEK